MAGGLVGSLALELTHLQPARHRDYGVSRRTGAVLLALCGALLVLLPLLPLLAAGTGSVVAAAVSAFYQAGALVFGGGHVVLPLLQAGVVPTGWVSNDAFLAGYGAAQAVPGPLFTFAAYLGAAMPAPLGGWLGGLVLLLAIFAPAFLLVAGSLPFWEALRQRDGAPRAIAGVNAAVVSVLGGRVVRHGLDQWHPRQVGPRPGAGSLRPARLWPGVPGRCRHAFSRDRDGARASGGLRHPAPHAGSPGRAHRPRSTPAPPTRCRPPDCRR